MSAHELAKALLDGADLPVTIYAIGRKRLDEIHSPVSDLKYETYFDTANRKKKSRVVILLT